MRKRENFEVAKERDKHKMKRVAVKRENLISKWCCERELLGRNKQWSGLF
jgi:hypothetical protein